MTARQRILILAEQRGLSSFRDVPEGDAEIAEKWLLDPFSY